MKTLNIIVASLALTFLGTRLQGANIPVPDATPYRVVERGADHQVWQQETYEPRANGIFDTHVHKNTELASGLNFFDNGQWMESKVEIELLPDGSGAVATKGQHQVLFPADIYSGAIELGRTCFRCEKILIILPNFSVLACVNANKRPFCRGKSMVNLESMRKIYANACQWFSVGRRILKFMHQ